MTKAQMMKKKKLELKAYKMLFNKEFFIEYLNITYSDYLF